MYINSTNNQSFQGRKEVIYALSKAAECSKAISRMRQNIYKTDRNMLLQNEASRDAYIDMACHDAAFMDTISSLDNSELKKFNSLLKSLNTARSGRIRPLDNFRDAITSAYMKKLEAESRELQRIRDFINNISKR